MTSPDPGKRKLSQYLGIDFVVQKLILITKRLTNLVARIDRIEKLLLERNVVSQGPDKGIQNALALLYRDLAERGTILPFEEVEFRVYSQFGEDGILHYIFSLIGTSTKKSVELCAGVGSECNTANLILNHAWHALLLDGNEAHVKEGVQFFRAHPDTTYSPPTFLQRWITRENVNEIIESAGYSGDIELLSLDMDGVDYWIWEALTAVSPRVVIVEVNPHMGQQPVTVPYADDFNSRWIRLDDQNPAQEDVHNRNLHLWTVYGGASLAAFNKLAKRKGYRLVGCNRQGANVIFMRQDIGLQYFPEISESACYPPAGKINRERGAEVLLKEDLVEV